LEKKGIDNRYLKVRNSDGWAKKKSSGECTRGSKAGKEAHWKQGSRERTIKGKLSLLKKRSRNTSEGKKQRNHHGSRLM